MGHTEEMFFVKLFSHKLCVLRFSVIQNHLPSLNGDTFGNFRSCGTSEIFLNFWGNGRLFFFGTAQFSLKKFIWSKCRTNICFQLEKKTFAKLKASFWVFWHLETFLKNRFFKMCF